MKFLLLLYVLVQDPAGIGPASLNVQEIGVFKSQFSCITTGKKKVSVTRVMLEDQFPPDVVVTVAYTCT